MPSDNFSNLSVAQGTTKSLLRNCCFSKRELLSAPPVRATNTLSSGSGGSAWVMVFKGEIKVKLKEERWRPAALHRWIQAL